MFSPQCLRESQHEKCTRRGSGGEHNSCHCHCPVPTQPSLSHAELWCIVFRTAKHRRVSTDLSARGATACATHASPLAEPFQLQLSGLEASSTASGGALGCLPARLLIPRPPPRPRPQFICSSFGEGRVFPEFVAGLPACRSDRPHGQPASNSQHQPASSLLVNFDRGIGSQLHLESQPAGHWPWDMAIAHRPIAHLANPQQGPPNGRRRTSEQQRP